MIRAILLNRLDNVATLVDHGKQGQFASLIGVGAGTVMLASDIDFGHKIATRQIEEGEEIRKYGAVVGKAVCSIRVGEHVHVHNVEALRGRGDRMGTVA